MRKETRHQLDAYKAQVAQINGVTNPAEKFAVEPTIQQTLEDKIQESSPFLSQINMVGVREQQGQKLGLGMGAPIASTTDTSDKDRQTSNPMTLDKKGYHCQQINSDTHLTYALIDMWAKFPDFQLRLRNAFIAQQARDCLMIGFNGTHRVADSDRVANPLLQDVAPGWLQKYRDDAPERVMGTDEPIIIGKDAADYANYDALVMDAVNSLIEPWYQEDTGLIAICGRDVLFDKLFPIVNGQELPTEKIAAEMIVGQKRLGLLPAVRVPFFPKGTIFITRYDNLSLYWQEGSRRRTLVDNAKRDRFENYESSNDDYIVEDYGCGCLIENITLQGAEPEAPEGGE